MQGSGKRIMSETRSHRKAGLTRRTAVFGLVAALASPAMAADSPALTYMKKVAKDMLNAHRQGTVAAFKRAIQRHADVPAIADYSLGQYKPKLAAAQKQAYYAGAVSFMSRYFADQSRDYTVSKYEIGKAEEDGKDISVQTKVFLMSGQSYTVVWKLVKKGSGYKVADAKVMGFSLIYLQRGIFTSYLSKRNGDVAQLVAALNR
jgi:phospholipid transport system substrate-binding protein